MKTIIQKYLYLIIVLIMNFNYKQLMCSSVSNFSKEFKKIEIDPNGVFVGPSNYEVVDPNTDKLMPRIFRYEVPNNYQLGANYDPIEKKYYYYDCFDNYYLNLSNNKTFKDSQIDTFIFNETYKKLCNSIIKEIPIDDPENGLLTIMSIFDIQHINKKNDHAKEYYLNKNFYTSDSDSDSNYDSDNENKNKFILKHSYHHKSIANYNFLNGLPFLHYSVEFHQKQDIAQQLLLYRADPNKSDLCRDKPLDYAVNNQYNNKDMVTLLLLYGANIVNRPHSLLKISDMKLNCSKIYLQQDSHSASDETKKSNTPPH